jgi:hypothetical protein
MVPDGTPVAARLSQQLASATAKVGDDVELTVARPVWQEDGSIIIPKDTELSGRVTSVRHAGRMSRYGSVTFTVDKVVFPGGETASLREAASNEGAGKKFREAADNTARIAVDPGLNGMGLPLLAIFGPVLLVEKGHERVYHKGSTTTLYIHGPIYLQREAVLKIQPPPYEGPARVFYANRGGGEAAFHRQFYCGRVYLGEVTVGETFQLELNPGAYWFSVGQKGEKVRLEVQADHQYYVEREIHGLVIKDLHANQGWLDGHREPLDKDFTTASSETTAELMAEGPSVNAAHGVH